MASRPSRLVTLFPRTTCARCGCTTNVSKCPIDFRCTHHCPAPGPFFPDIFVVVRKNLFDCVVNYQVQEQVIAAKNAVHLPTALDIDGDAPFKEALEFWLGDPRHGSASVSLRKAGNYA